MAGRQITSIDGNLGDLLHKTFVTPFRFGYIKVDGCIMPQNYTEFADAIDNFEVRDDDVWVCTFPKSGTTWAQEMVWCIVNDLDFERAKVPLYKRFPSLETSAVVDMSGIKRRSREQVEEEFLVDSVTYAANLPSPRFIKTHLQTNLLPRDMRDGEKKPRVIYVVRNPKDTCISFYHYCKYVEAFEGSFEEFYTLFLGETLHYGPYWKHVLGYWTERNNYNMLFLQYEDMKKNLPSVIKKTAKFLGKNLTSDQVSSLTEHLSFSSMKANPAVNTEDVISNLHQLFGLKREGVFMRKGTTNQWKTEMTPELIKRFDDWTSQHLNGTGLSLENVSGS